MYVPPLLENGTIFLYLKVGWLPKICSFLGIHIGRTGWGATTLLSALCWPSKWTMTPHPWPTSRWKAGKSAADVLSISSDVQCWMCDTQKKCSINCWTCFSEFQCFVRIFDATLPSNPLALEADWVQSRWRMRMPTFGDSRPGPAPGWGLCQRVFWRPMPGCGHPELVPCLQGHGSRGSGMWTGGVAWKERSNWSEPNWLVRVQELVVGFELLQVGGSKKFDAYHSTRIIGISSSLQWLSQGIWIGQEIPSCDARQGLGSRACCERIWKVFESKMKLEIWLVKLCRAYVFMEIHGNSLKLMETISNYIQIVMKMMWNHPFFGAGKPWYLLRGLVLPVDLMPWFDGWGSAMSSFKKRKPTSYIYHIYLGKL